MAQTFQNFEVIVVDDCSTDNSVAVAKSYAARFGGRFNLIQTKKNSGAPGVPGNMGVNFSRGEYLLILDNDDAITPDAIEKLYSTAKNFDADVVACEKYFEVPDKFWNDAEYLRTLKPLEYRRGPFVSKPTLITNDIAKRVQECAQNKFLWNIWSKLIRRDFIIKNELRFTDNFVQDMIFTCCLVFSAKRFVRVPNVINLYRVVEESISHPTDKGLKYFRKYVKALMPAFRHFDSFLSGIDFFSQNPVERYLALETVWNEATEYIVPMYGQIPLHEFDKILREELSEGDNFALKAFAFNAANAFYRQLICGRKEASALRDLVGQSQQYIAELEGEIRRLKGQA